NTLCITQTCVIHYTKVCVIHTLCNTHCVLHKPFVYYTNHLIDGLCNGLCNTQTCVIHYTKVCVIHTVCNTQCAIHSVQYTLCIAQICVLHKPSIHCHWFSGFLL